MNTIGDRIKECRVERGLTQKELGDKCGMADSAIRRYELGKANPKYETLKKIANALDTHPMYLMGQISQEYANSLNTRVDYNTAFNSIMHSIFGFVDEKVVRVDDIGNDYYYLLGTGKTQIAISEYNIEKLQTELEAYIKEFVKNNSDTEENIINESIDTLKAIKHSPYYKYIKEHNNALSEHEK